MTLLRASIGALVALVALLLWAAPASAARNIQVGFADDLHSDALLYGEPSVGDFWAGRMADAGGEIARINTYWRDIAGANVPADKTDPADPAYDWTELDAAVRASDSAGLEILFTVLSAPDYAEGEGRPADVRPGTWKPSGEEFRKFAIALATRYSGSYPDPLNPGQSLPQVIYYEGWNEPNLHLYINPQRQGKKLRSPEIYRELLNGFYAGIKSVDSSNIVLGAGTGPFGDPSGNLRVQPVAFWREVLCLKGKPGKVKKDKDCPAPEDQAHMDLFAHNSINEPGQGPTKPAIDPENATAADMYKMVELIRSAEKFDTVQPAGVTREVWGTELWFESNPPETQKGKAVPLKKQAQFMAQAIYTLWKQKVSAAIFLQIRDSEFVPGGPAVVGLQSGVYFFDETPKPSLKATRFPFVAERTSTKKVIAWGKAPSGGRVAVEVKAGKGGWQEEFERNVSAGQVFKKNLKLEGSAKLRAVLDGDKTITWKVKKK